MQRRPELSDKLILKMKKSIFSYQFSIIIFSEG